MPQSWIVFIPYGINQQATPQINGITDEAGTQGKFAVSPGRETLMLGLKGSTGDHQREKRKEHYRQMED